MLNTIIKSEARLRAGGLPGGVGRRWGCVLGVAVLSAAMAYLPAHADQQSRSSGSAVPAAVPAAGVATGMDGFVPFLHTTTGQGAYTQAWVIAHHGYSSMTAPRVSCVNVNTGGFCADASGNPTTWPKPLNINSGSLGSGNTGDLATTQIPQMVQASGSDVVYYPAVTTQPVTGFPNGSVGAGCLDMKKQTNCGYTPLAALTNVVGQSNVNGLTGFVVQGSRAYGTTTNGLEVCFALSNGKACPGQPFATNTPPSNDAAGLGPTDFTGTTTVVNGRIYIASNGSRVGNGRTHPPTLTCFDPNTNASCAGWTPKVITDPNASLALAIFPDLNIPGVPIGVCTVVGNKTPAAPIVACFDFTGTSIGAPAGMTALLAQLPATGRNVVFQPLTTTVGTGQRTYLPFYVQKTGIGHTVCYSWTSQSACPGFPAPLAHPGVNGGRTQDYGYTYNSTLGCIYGDGDKGYLFSFNAITGASGC
ncbi:hypothetical protein [Streptosporangium sp. NPDC087985]|uniref:hypothetical protein n=1 Tax=Streptosporangium sp. NPDC087985 TaxID=3366196 RepID=UPI0038265921